MQEPFSLGHVVREHVGREQAFEEVVVADVAFAAGKADHPGDGVPLEHRADGVLRQPEPVLGCADRHLEVE